MFCISATDEGIMNCRSDLQLLNANSPIWFNSEGETNDTSVNDEHSLKELFPIEVTDEGIDIFSKDLQSVNE